MGNVIMDHERCEFSAYVNTDLLPVPARIKAVYDGSMLTLTVQMSFESAKEFIHKLAVAPKVLAPVAAPPVPTMERAAEEWSSVHQLAAAGAPLITPPKSDSTTTLPTAESANKILDRIAADRKAAVKAASKEVNESHSGTLHKLADVPAPLRVADVVKAVESVTAPPTVETKPTRDAIVERVDAGVMIHLDDIPESIRNANTLREVLSGMIEDGVGKLRGQEAVEEATRRCLVLRKGGRVPALNRIASDALEERVRRAAELLNLGGANA